MSSLSFCLGVSKDMNMKSHHTLRMCAMTLINGDSMVSNKWGVHNAKQGET